MKERMIVSLLLTGLGAGMLSAQESKAKVASDLPYPYTGQSSSLTAAQKLGQRMFQQRCALCHTLQDEAIRQPGPRISKDINEDVAKTFIMNGSPNKMPAFKYGLNATEIAGIIAYIRTGLATPSVDQVGPLPPGRGGRGAGVTGGDN